MNQNIRNKNQAQQKNRGSILPLMLFFPISIFFCELVARLSTFGDLKISQFFSDIADFGHFGIFYFIYFILDKKPYGAENCDDSDILYYISCVCVADCIF